ncbi:MAG: response regulator [Anaerolineae bacterium]
MHENPSVTESLSRALNNLYDPTYEPEARLRRALGAATHEALQAKLLATISDLAPSSDCPSDAPTLRYHRILHHRFVQGWTLAHTAEELGISVRHLSRQQKEAIAWLASRIESTREPERQPWMSVVRREIDAVLEETPGAITDLGEVLDRVRELAKPLAQARQIDLTVERAPGNVLVAGPATLVEQAILVTFDRMTATEASRAEPTRAGIVSGQEPGNQASVSIAVMPPRTDQEPSDYLGDELLSRQGGSRTWRVTKEKAECVLHLPAMQPVTILLIEDNQDLFYVYQRYVRGTPYRIVHLTDVSDLTEALHSARPDIIVLDIMLPEGDGWQILTRLHQSPETRDIPVIVCSVVRAQELAIALGAAVYLPKPVQRDQFIDALNRVRSLPPERT